MSRSSLPHSSIGPDSASSAGTLSLLTGTLLFLLAPAAQGGFSISNASPVTEGDTGSRAMQFTVSLDTCPASLCRVFVTAFGGTATKGADFTFDDQQLVFPPGGGQFPVLAAIHGDDIVEYDQTVQLRLFGAVNAGIDDADGVGTILDDDSVVITTLLLTAGAATTEGNPPWDTSFVQLHLSHPGTIEPPIAIQVVSEDITATLADGDYEQTPPVYFGGGRSNQDFVGVRISVDERVELDETFRFTLVPPSNIDVTLSETTWVATIQNDDVATVTVDDVQIMEGDGGFADAVFTMTLDKDVDHEVGIEWLATSDTAAVQDDFVLNGGMLYFGTSAGSQTQTVKVRGDDLVELDETFHVELRNVDAGGRAVALQSAPGTGTIIDDDQATVTIHNVGQLEGTTGTTSEGDLAGRQQPPIGTTLFDLEVTLEGDVDVPVLVDYETADGTATVANGDYKPVSSFLSFLGIDGESYTVTVPVVSDAVSEADETFEVRISLQDAGGRNVVILQDVGTATIFDDDSLDDDPFFADGFESGDLGAWTSPSGGR